MRSKILIILLFLVLTGCGKDGDENKNVGPVEYNFILTENTSWLNTGIKLQRGKVVTISTNEERAIGSPVVDPDDPIPFFGHRGLIGKIGEKGLPFIIGMRYTFLTNTLMEGENLFIGWNDKDFEEREEGFPSEISVTVKIEDTDAPPLISPIDGIWVNTATPVFEWEDLDNAVQYVLEVSLFPDFRIIETSVSVTTSYVNLTVPSVQAPTPSPQPQVQLQEGTHYWRVRAQVNVGRSLSPILQWTKWSPPYRLGVELGASPSAPTFLSPVTPTGISEGEKVFFEFKTNMDPSYTFWRWRAVTTACGETPQIDPDDPTSGNPTPWMVLQTVLSSNNPTEPPYYYGYFTSPELTRGEWLIRVELKDMNGSTSYSDMNLSIGCAEESQ
jgi:hypothetical protein